MGVWQFHDAIKRINWFGKKRHCTIEGQGGESSKHAIATQITFDCA